MSQDIKLSVKVYISTNRPPVPQSLVGWSLGSFKKGFWRNHRNALL